MPGVDFTKLFEEMNQAGINHFELTVTEIVDWDRAPMRKYFHGVVIPAFAKKYNETCKHEHKAHFSNTDIKDFLKIKFIGWTKNSAYNKWGVALQMNSAGDNIFSYVKICELLKGVQGTFLAESTEMLTPEGYMDMINDCEAYYFELFNEMYDCRQKPELNKGKL